MANQLRNLQVEFVSLVDQAAVRDPSSPTEPQRFLLYKRDTQTSHEGDASMNDNTDALELVKAERDKLARKVEKLQSKLEKRDAPAKPAAIDKSALTPEVRAVLEKAELEAAETRERAEKAEKIAKAERNERIEREFIAKAQRELPHLGNPAEIGPRLKRMSEQLSKEDYDAHLAELQAANARIETGSLFAELGKSGEASRGGESTAEQILSKAQEIRKADPSLTEWQAMEQARLSDRETQARYLASQR